MFIVNGLFFHSTTTREIISSSIDFHLRIFETHNIISDNSMDKY